MSFKWDWEKRELVEGEEPIRERVWFEPILVLGLIGIGWVLVEFVCPFLGHLFFGGFL
jgi:hypothetical protein